MLFSRRRFSISLSLLPALPLCLRAQAGLDGSFDRSVFSGRIVSLGEVLKNEHKVLLDADRGGIIYCLKANDGRLLPVLPTDSAAAIYDDPHFRQRELQVTARTFAGQSFIEVIRIQSVKWGRVFDMYFYCIVCNIKSHKPGPCECCQDPLVFTETPAADSSAK